MSQGQTQQTAGDNKTANPYLLRGALLPVMLFAGSAQVDYAELAGARYLLAGVLALQQGFSRMFVERGRDDMVVLLRPGAAAEGESAEAASEEKTESAEPAETEEEG